MDRSARRRTQKCPKPGYRCKRRTRCNETEGRCSIASLPTREFSRRCENGSRRQRHENGCIETGKPKYERCKNGTRRDKRTHECDAWGVYMFKNRKKIIARGQHLQRMAKSANARVKKHKRFALIPDAPGAAEHRERMLKDYVPEELPMAPVGALSPKPKSPRKPNENLANPFKVRPRKSSPGRKSNDKEKDETMNNYNLNDFDRRISMINVHPRKSSPSRKSNDEEEDETMNNYDMNDFDQGDAMMGEHPPPLSPVQEVENEDDEDKISSPRQIVPRKTPKKIHNTRSSSQRTRSEKAKYKVDYGSRKSRKSM